MSGFNVAGVSKTIQNRRKSTKVVNQKLFGTVRSRVCSSIDEVNGSGNGDQPVSRLDSFTRNWLNLDIN